MAVPVDPAKAATVESIPESPTTARPLEMDDDDVQDTGITLDDRTGATKETNTSSAAATSANNAPADSTEAPPPRPPRPVSEQQQNEQILKEAFPSIDAAVIRAVLRASRGQVEPAFNALLEMTDPDAVRADEVEERPPPPPPRPVAAPAGVSATPADQLEADELYARRLAEQYENSGAYEARTSSRGSGGMPRGRQQTGLKPNELYDDHEHSFLDDDFPVIKESLKKGFMETQTKVNSWFNNLKKKIDEQFDDGEEGQHGGQGSSVFAGGGPTRNQSRRSAEYDRYDADPEVLSDDFGGLKFHTDGTPIIPNQPSRANPNLFKPPPPSKSPRSSSGRRVAFNDSVEDIDAYNASPRIPPKDASPAPGSAGKTSKWQPLSMVDPSPVADNDPFSLGDSDDERETKDKTTTVPAASTTTAIPVTASTGGATAAGGSKEVKESDDAERLRKAAAEAMADSLVEDDKATKV